MNDVLKAFKLEMAKLNLNYHYLIYKGKNVVYPYVTGEFTRGGYSFEDGSNTGDFLLEIWAKDLNDLIDVSEKIKKHFRNVRLIVNGKAIIFSWNGDSPSGTNIQDLYKQTVHIDVNYWEGE